MNELSFLNSLLGADDYGLASFPVLASCSTVPTVDVKETKDDYVLDMDLPGWNENDIALDLDGNTLTIASQNKDSAEDKTSEKKDTALEDTYLLRERNTSGFKRQFELPEDSAGEAARASFKNGVLTITVPRKQVVASSKKINIVAA